MANRDVTVKLTELGSDIENISIYKSSFTDANYIASVSRAVLMGDGYTFSVDDQISKFLLYSGEPCNTTLELNLPSPTTTTTTAGTTTTSTTTTTAAPTTTTTTPEPQPGDVSFTVYFNDSLTNADFNTGSQTITAQPGDSGLSIASKTIAPETNYVNSSYSVSIGGNNPGAISGPTSVTNSVSGFTLNMPQNGGNATITVTGSATPVATTTTTSTTTTSTTTTSTTTTTTVAPISTRFYYSNQTYIYSMASDANPSSVFLYRAGGTSFGVGTQLYTDAQLTTQASSVNYGDWIGMESSGGVSFVGIYNAGNNITAPTMSGGDTLVKINNIGVVTEVQGALVYMGLYEGQSCSDAFTATTSSSTGGHYISAGSFMTGGVKNFGTGLFNGNYYARYIGSSLEVGQYTASPSGASNGYFTGVTSSYECPS